jgi:hypothetical protein
VHRVGHQHFKAALNIKRCCYPHRSWGGRDQRWRETVLIRCTIRDCKEVSVFAEQCT